MSFFAQMAGMCRRQDKLVSVVDRPGLLARYADSAPRTDARFALFAGASNRAVFSRRARSAPLISSSVTEPGMDSLHVLPSYGHLDPFLGKTAGDDVFHSCLPNSSDDRTSTPLSREGLNDETPRSLAWAFCSGGGI